LKRAIFEKLFYVSSLAVTKEV